MKRLGLFLVALAAVAWGSQQAWAQRPGGGRGFGGGGFGGSPVFLLMQESVQDELKLSGEQVQQATELVEKQRSSFEGFRELSQEERRERFEEVSKANDEALGNILKADQLQRLKQISLQVRGSFALGDPKVAEALALTADQKKQIASIQQDAGEEMRDAAEGDRQQIREKMAAIRKSVDDKSLAVLTPDQEKTWKDMNGAPFEGEIRRGGFGGGDRPGGRRNRPDGGNQ